MRDVARSAGLPRSERTPPEGMDPGATAFPPGFRRCFDLGMNHPPLRCWSGGRNLPGVLVREQSCFDGDAEVLQGALQWAIRVARRCQRRIKNLLVQCSILLQTPAAKAEGGTVGRTGDRAEAGQGRRGRTARPRRGAGARQRQPPRDQHFDGQSTEVGDRHRAAAGQVR